MEIIFGCTNYLHVTGVLVTRSHNFICTSHIMQVFKCHNFICTSHIMQVFKCLQMEDTTEWHILLSKKKENLLYRHVSFFTFLNITFQLFTAAFGVVLLKKSCNWCNKTLFYAQ